MTKRGEREGLAAGEGHGTLVVEQHTLLLLLLEERRAEGREGRGLEEDDEVNSSLGAEKGVAVHHAEKEGEAAVYGVKKRTSEDLSESALLAPRPRRRSRTHCLFLTPAAQSNESSC